jgi:undecaprenyl-diphosphatase
MESDKQKSRALNLSLWFALGFWVLAILVNLQYTVYIDNHIIAYILSYESPGMTGLMKFFTWIGSGGMETVLIIALILIFYFLFDHRRELILLVQVMVGSELLNVLLKLLFHRERPNTHRLIDITGYSFPSGHSMGAFTFYGVLCFLFWRHLPFITGKLLVLCFSCAMILAIGISRIYLGVHYPTDVLGGYLASGAWLFLSIWVYMRNKGYRKKRSL